jgi:hypothetical protein
MIALDFGEGLPFDSIQVPEVSLQGNHLCFRPAGPLHPVAGRRERLVFDFANLADASAGAFLEFARSWGALGLCKHQLSILHELPPCLASRADNEFVEPISYWRRRARPIRAILNIKTSLRQGGPGSPADWKIIWRGRPPNDRTDAAQTLGIVTSILLSQSNAHLAIFFIDGHFTINFIGGNLVRLVKAMGSNEATKSWLATSGNLLAQIAVGTAFALQEGTGWTLCSAPDCGRLYRPKRRPAEDRRHFCPKCGKRASWRLSKQRAAVRNWHK